MPPAENPSPQSQTSTEQWQLELFERLIKIESKLDQYNELRSTAFSAESLSRHNHEDVNELKIQAQKITTTADKANSCAINNKDAITEIKDELKWGKRTVGFLIFAAIINLLSQFFTT